MSCSGKRCGFNIQVTKEAAGCSEGDGSCFEARVLTAERSNFHDEELMDATAKIRQILAGIGRDPKGRKLSFINTNMGLLLAWVEHGAPVPPDAVTDKDDDTTIAQALRLSGYAKVQGETAS